MPSSKAVDVGKKIENLEKEEIESIESVTGELLKYTGRRPIDFPEEKIVEHARFIFDRLTRLRAKVASVLAKDRELSIKFSFIFGKNPGNKRAWRKIFANKQIRLKKLDEYIDFWRFIITNKRFPDRWKNPFSKEDWKFHKYRDEQIVAPLRQFNAHEREILAMIEAELPKL